MVDTNSHIVASNACNQTTVLENYCNWRWKTWNNMANYIIISKAASTAPIIVPTIASISAHTNTPTDSSINIQTYDNETGVNSAELTQEKIKNCIKEWNNDQNRLNTKNMRAKHFTFIIFCRQ